MPVHNGMLVFVTLVLTAIAPNFVVQVSDRLVTQSPGGRPLDLEANKTVIYLAKNALVTIGYSGRAYIEGVPTDHWIAQVLRDQEFQQPGGRGLLMIGPAPRLFDIGIAVMRLREALSRKVSDTHQHVTIAGVQQAKKRYRSCGYRVHNYGSGGRSGFSITTIPRQIPQGRGELIRNPWVLTQEELDAVNARLSEDPTSPEATEKALVESIRTVAARSPFVGPHCLSVQILPSITVRVRFLPAETHTASVGSGVLDAHPDVSGPWGGAQVPLAYAPFLVGPDAVQFPSVFFGSSLTTSVGGIKWFWNRPSH